MTSPFQLLTNIIVNLRAAGPAAVLVVWIICITLLGLFGEGPLADRALTIVSLVGTILAMALAARADK